MPRKDTMILKGEVLAGQKRVVKRTIPEDCTIERLYNRLYSGSVGQFKIFPWIVRNGDIYESLLIFGDPQKPYLSGDDDRDEFDITVEARKGDRIEIWGVNDGTETYDINVGLTIDNYGGRKRVQ